MKDNQKFIKDYLTCEDCGANNETVIRTYCPYANEINNKQVEVTLCQECYSNRCEEM